MIKSRWPCSAPLPVLVLIVGGCSADHRADVSASSSVDNERSLPARVQFAPKKRRAEEAVLVGGGEPSPVVLKAKLDAVSSRVRTMHAAWLTDDGGRRSDSALKADGKRLAAILDPVLDHAAAGAKISVHVRDMRSQHTLYDRGADELRNPASNQKMLTASAALDLLGADYRFETRILRSGSVIYLVGEGDPSRHRRHSVVGC